MKRLLGLVGMTIGGWLGWQLGILVSFFIAFVAGMIGTGVGLYFGHRAARRLAP